MTTNTDDKIAKAVERLRSSRTIAVREHMELAAVFVAAAAYRNAEGSLDAAEDLYRATFKADGDEWDVYEKHVSPACIRVAEAKANLDAALSRAAKKVMQ